MKRCLILIFLCFTLTGFAYCQWRQLRWNNTAGATAAVINSGFKAQNKHLWFGTNQGLYDFDPVSGFWSFYNTLAGLTDNYIYSVFEDSYGSVWIATNKGISHLSNNKMTSFTMKDGLSSNLVRAFTQTPGGTLYTGTFEGGVCSYSPGSGFKRIALRTRGDSCILSLLALSDSTVLIGTFNRGLILLQNDSALSINNPSALNGRIIYSLFRSHAGDIWIGTDQGAQKYDPFYNKVLPGSDSLTGKTVFSICENDSGDIIFGVYNRLYELSKGTWSSFIPSNMPKPSSFYSVLFGDDNNLWAGTSTQGLFMRQGDQWSHANAFSDNVFYGMCEDKYHKMWFFSAHNLYSYNDTLWKQIPLPVSDHADSQILQVLSDTSGNIWCYRYPREVFRFDGSKWIDFISESHYSGQQISYMAVAPNGDIWFTTWNEGICRYNGTSWKYFTSYINGLSSSTYNVLDFFPDGKLVAGSWDGILSFYDGANWTNDALMKDSYSFYDMAIDRNNYVWLAGSSIIKYKDNDRKIESEYYGFTRLDVDKYGHVWAGNDYFGLFFYNGQNWQTYTTADGLASNNSTDILVDSKGRIWTTSREGISVSDNLVTASPEIRSDVFGGNSFPNPFSDLLNIRYHSDSPGNASVRFFSQDGSMIRQFTEHMQPGDNLFQYNTTAWPEGLVICTITMYGNVTRQKLVKISFF